MPLRYRLAMRCRVPTGLSVLCVWAAACVAACVDPAGGEAVAPFEHEVVVSGGASDTDALPMVLVLHGRGDRPRPRGFASRHERARWVFPAAPIPFGQGFSWFEYTTPEDTALAGRLVSRATELARFVDWATRHYPTPTRDVYVMGVSQGGMLTFALLAGHADKVRGALPVMGLLPASIAFAQGPRRRVFAIHGRQDRVVPFAAGEAALRRAERAGHAATLVALESTGHQMNAEVDAAMRRAFARLWRD